MKPPQSDQPMREAFGLGAYEEAELGREGKSNEAHL
jgi:hypothetical protein